MRFFQRTPWLVYLWLAARAAAEPVEIAEPAPTLSAQTARALNEARKEAAARFGNPRCGGLLLQSYKAASGQTLSSAAEALGAGPGDYVRWLVFRDAGPGSKLCREKSTIFFTAPGSRVVFLCGERFAEVHSVDSSLATALVIHEMLHSLGLGENPPSPAQITARVRDLCGL